MKNKFLANKRVPFSFFVILVISNLALLSLVGWLISQNKDQILNIVDGETTPSQSSTVLRPATQQGSTPTVREKTTRADTPAATLTLNAQMIENFGSEGFMVFSLADGIYRHLFIYHPNFLPMTRLWNQNWDDITPAIHPDGTRFAFSSNRNGYWDLYLYDFTTGNTDRITDTTGYDANPSWSPDGEWIVYESYIDNNLEIFIQSVRDPSQPAIRLTEDPAADFSPSWSANGRQIAFVSTRSGDEEIWIANLDDDQNRFFNFSQNPTSHDTHPAWSPDGTSLAWAANQNGLQQIIVKSIAGDEEGKILGAGKQPVWSPTGTSIVCLVESQNQVLFGGYFTSSGEIALPFTQLPTNVMGMDWKESGLLSLITNLNNPESSGEPTPLWSPIDNISPPPPYGRYGLVPIADVNVANPYLQDHVNESFEALRKQIAQLSGWDFLGNLESAYQPITSPSPPDMVENWFYTGRAFAINPLPMSADWMVITREDFAGQTFWRLFIKARYQDGSQGMPLKRMIWDLDTRFSGEPRAYEDGGKVQAIPEGYWIDFTEFALRYGWQRLPALTNWRTYYHGTRFNLFVLTENLDWQSAMAQLYPPEAMMTITYVPTATVEALYTATHTPTLHPTYTPEP